MAEPWIRVHANLATKPVTLRLAGQLHISINEAVGLLVRFWGQMSQHGANGSVQALTDLELEAWGGWTRKRGAFAAFIREHHTDEHGRVREWDEYAGKLEIRRTKDRERKRNSSGIPAESERNSNGHPRDLHSDSIPARAVRNETKRNDTSKATTAQRKNGVESSNGANWVDPLQQLWSSRVGPITHGRIGKALKEAHAAHGLDDLLRGMESFITAQRVLHKPCEITWFARDVQTWLTGREIGVIDGEMSPELERLTRP